MAKIRVHELARELNMTNKALLEKLQAMNLPTQVRSHMSSLDNEVATLVKSSLVKPKTKKVDEKRIGTRVIRRRKKAAPEVPKVEAVEKEAEPEEALEKEPAAIAETAKKPAPKKKAKRAPKAKKASKPAKIVKPAPVEKAEEPAKEKVKTEEKPKAKAKKPAKKKAEAKEKAKAEEKPKAKAKKPAKKKAEAKEKAKAKVKAEEKPETKKKTKAKKKKKKEFAAKIISLPEKPVEPTIPPTARKKPAKSAKPAKLAKPGGEYPQDDKKPESKKDRRKKKGKKDMDEETDSRFFKKKISFRKKAVVEGSDLYDRRPPRLRKGKKGQKVRFAKSKKTITTTPKAIKRRIKVDEAVALADLAKRMGIKAAELIKSLMDMGTMATVNQMLDFETAVLLASEFDYEVEKASFEEETVLKTEKDAPETMEARPPVVTIMGHVDHGKTSLLDAIRKANVTAGEAGGITQHIGAYMVDVSKGKIAFLDTPGHEAFTAMRARGAQITDIVILVVAADDGVMPQTVEAINHSKAAEVPIIVAINKMDKDGADPDRVMRELAEHDLVPEDWGGETIFVKVSAKKKTGIKSLLEMILLQAEVMELAANPNKLARGHVVEATVDPGRGIAATVLVHEGTLRAGDPIVCGIHFGKVRAMYDHKRQSMDLAGPSCPVEILGLSGVPMAGDEIAAVANEKTAKQISQSRAQKHRTTELAQSSKLSLDTLFEQMEAGDVKDLNLIIKADVQGSIEALRESLEKLSGDEVKINIIHSATGTVLESDVSLAAVSNAIIIAFNVRPNPKTSDMATEESVDIRFYNVIYNAINEIKDSILGMMESTYKEHQTGHAEVRDTFTIPKIGTIAGSYITDGKVTRGDKSRLLRDGVVIYDGKLKSLRRFKDDAKEVASGYECGIGIENFNDIKVGDVIEFYYLEEIKPVLE